MPESKVRKEAAEKKAAKRLHQSKVARQENKKKSVRLAGTRNWVPPVFITVGLIGVIWLILYYVAGDRIWGIKDLGQWNFLIGIGCIAAAFAIATQWK